MPWLAAGKGKMSFRAKCRQAAWAALLLVRGVAPAHVSGPGVMILTVECLRAGGFVIGCLACLWSLVAIHACNRRCKVKPPLRLVA